MFSYFITKVKNSSIIEHRSIGGLVGYISSGTLTMNGTITMENVSVQTVGGRSALIVGFYDSTFDYYDKFGSGNQGPIAAVTLHAGGAYGGDATFNYVFENVTADTIVAGTTENGKIIVSGVNLTRTVIGSNVTVK